MLAVAEVEENGTEFAAMVLGSGNVSDGMGCGLPTEVRQMRTHASSMLLAVAMAGLLTLSFPGDAKSQARLRAASVETLTGEIDGGSGGISVDHDGNIYVADFGSRLGGNGTGGHRVFLVTPAGETSVFAQGFRGASGNEFDSQGNFFQSNIGGGYISMVDTDGTITQFVGGMAAPVGIVSDSEDNLYVTNCGNNSIQRVTPWGEAERFVASDLLKCPNGIVMDDHGNLYVANFGNGGVIKITPEKEVTELASLPGNNNGHLLHHDGFLYVIDRGGHQIYSVSLDGEIELFAGSGDRGNEDGSPLDASFSWPNDIGISPDGKSFYVNDVAGGPADHRILAPMLVRVIRVAD
jgi:sugar lactone lactonase YvrE